jgi:hypothetical protein
VLGLGHLRYTANNDHIIVARERPLPPLFHVAVH